MLKTGEMLIDGNDVSKYGARILNYTVGSSKITPIYNTPTKPIMPQIYSTTASTRTLTVTLSYEPLSGSNLQKRLHQTMLQKSRLETLFAQNKTVEIQLPDGHYYTAIITAISDAVPDNTATFDVTYTCEAVMHGELITDTFTSGSKMLLNNSVAESPLIIKLKPSAQTDIRVSLLINANDYAFAPITVEDIPANQTCIIDGVKGTVTVNGANWIRKTNLIDFPAVKGTIPTMIIAPTVTTTVTTTVSFYPTIL